MEWRVTDESVLTQLLEYSQPQQVSESYHVAITLRHAHAGDHPLGTEHRASGRPRVLRPHSVRQAPGSASSTHSQVSLRKTSEALLLKMPGWNKQRNKKTLSHIWVGYLPYLPSQAWARRPLGDPALGRIALHIHTLTQREDVSLLGRILGKPKAFCSTARSLAQCKIPGNEILWTILIS